MRVTGSRKEKTYIFLKPNVVFNGNNLKKNKIVHLSQRTGWSNFNGWLIY